MNQLSDKYLDQVLNEVLKVISQDMESLAAFVYGSRIEGLYNKFSDLDICVITRNRLKSDFTRIQDMEVNLESVPLNKLEDMIAIAQGSKFDFYAVLWCHRINVGISICDDKGILKELKDKLNVESISQKLVSHYCTVAACFLNDSLGAFESKDFETALVTARLGVENAVMAYLSSLYIISPYVKWAYRYLLRARKSADDDIVMQFRMLERACVNDETEIRRYIEAATVFINNLTTQIQVRA